MISAIYQQEKNGRQSFRALSTIRVLSPDYITLSAADNPASPIAVFRIELVQRFAGSFVLSDVSLSQMMPELCASISHANGEFVQSCSEGNEYV